MTAQEYLRQLYDIDERIAAAVEEYNKAVRLQKTITSPQSASAPRIGTPVTNTDGSTANTRRIDKALSFEADALEKLKRLKAKKNDIIATIDEVPKNRIRAVLRMRYVQKMRHKEIATVLDITSDHVKHLQRLGLTEVQIILDRRRESEGK